MTFNAQHLFKKAGGVLLAAGYLLLAAALYAGSPPPGIQLLSGVGDGTGPPFALYLGPGYRLLASGVGWSQSASFALYLGRLSQGYALSPPFPLDTRLSTAITPVLLQPQNDYQIASSADFSWQNLPNATSYQISLSTTPLMNTVVWTQSTTLNSYDYHPGPEMEPQATYYWSVRAYVNGVWTGYAMSRAIRRTFNPQHLDPPVAIKPIAGAGIALPDYFSWIMPSGAKKVLVEFSDDPNFGHTTGSGESTLDHMLVPAMTIGRVYYWRLKAVGDGSESEWIPARSFVVLGSCMVPSQATRISPLDDETINGNSIAFYWTDVPEATGYVIDISTQSSFQKSSNQTWRVGPVYATAKLVTVLPTNTTLYWKVTGVNSAGEGSPSLTGHFHVTNTLLPISSVMIIDPAADASVSQSGTLLATGLVTGSHTGTVTVQWLLDGVVFSSDECEMSGTGFETESVSVPTSDLGPHTLELRISGPSTVTSPVHSFTVVERVYDVPYKLSLIAIDPVLEVSSQTTILCRVLDSSERLVENDNGRMVTITVNGGGYLDPLTLHISNGQGQATYTATQAGEVTLSASDGALIEDDTHMSIKNTQLDVLKQRATAYLTRLGFLKWELFTSNQKPVDPKSFDVRRAQAFVSSCQEGSEQRLLRLNLFLRLLDRVYYHDPTIHKTYPGDDKLIYGVETLADDAAKSIGSTCIAGMAAASGVRGLKAENPFDAAYKEALSIAAKTILKIGDDIAKRLVNAIPVDQASKNLLLYMWHVMESTVQQYVGGPNFLGIAGALGDIGLQASMGNVVVRNSFVDKLQPVLDDVVKKLSGTDWQGGDDTRAIVQTDTTIGYARVKSAQAHSEYLSTDAGYNDWKVVVIMSLEELAGALSRNPIIIAGNIGNQLIKGTIYYATGFDCMNYVRGLSEVVSTTATKDIVTFYEPSTWSAEADSPRRFTIAEPQVEGDSRKCQSLTTNPAIKKMLNQVGSNLDAYEGLLRNLQASVQAGDTTAARNALAALYEYDDLLSDDEGMLYGPINAGLYEGQLLIPGLADSLDSVNKLGIVADSLKMQLWSFTDMWLSNSADGSTKLLASQEAGREVDAYGKFIGSMEGMVLQLLTTPAIPSLVITNVQVPDSAYCRASAMLSVDIQNLGAGTARGVRAIVDADTAVARAMTPYEVDIDSIAAGEKVHIQWKLSFVSLNLSPDSVYTLPMTFLADGTNALMDFREAALPLMKNPTTGVDPSKKTPKSSIVGVYPNPFNPSVTIELYGAGTNIPVEIEIFDVSGKEIRKVYSGRMSSGVNKYIWNGRSDSGNDVSSGVYFCRLRFGNEVKLKKVILLR